MDPAPQPAKPATSAASAPVKLAGVRPLLKRSLLGRAAGATPPPRPSALADPARPSLITLSWQDEDIENRWGLFKGGRFTSVNKLFSFILAAACSAAFLWLMHLFKQSANPALKQLGLYFMREKNIYATGPATVCFFWGVVIALLKIPKLRLQRRALDLAAVPQSREFVLNETTAKTVLERMRSLVDDTRYFILLNRIDRALSNLSNIGGVSDVSTILKAQSENDENQVASSYAMIHAMIWSIPVLGFVGTVLGLSLAISQFTGALNATTDITQIREQLKLVTAGLSTAFETTLVGLAFALLLHLLGDLVQQKETDFLDECNDYCHANVVSKLRVRPKEGNPA
jgi:biopolymer transport protein ExbB/TolQ